MAPACFADQFKRQTQADELEVVGEASSSSSSSPSSPRRCSAAAFPHNLPPPIHAAPDAPPIAVNDTQLLRACFFLPGRPSAPFPSLPEAIALLPSPALSLSSHTFESAPPSKCQSRPVGIALPLQCLWVLSTNGVGMNHTAVREHHIDLQALDRIIAPLLCCYPSVALVLSTNGVGMDHTAVREHHIDLQVLDRIIAPGDASRINAAALDAQRRPNPALQPAPGNLLERAARPLHRRGQVDTPDLLRAALPQGERSAGWTPEKSLASRASPATLKKIIGFYPRIRWCSFESGGRAEAVNRVLAKQPVHLPRGTVCPASPQVACSSLSKAGITLLLNRRTITYFGRLELSLALEGHAEAAEWEEAKDPAHRLPWAVCSASPSMPHCRGPRRRTSLFRLHDPHRGGLSWGFQMTRWAWALGADSGVRPPRPPATRYPTPTLFRTRRILQDTFYFFNVCPPIPTLHEHFWIDVQAPTGVAPISPCATQGDFFKEPSPITPHSIPPSPKPCAVKPNSSLEAPSPNPRHLGQGSRMDIQALAPVPPISPWRCHGEFRSLRTLDHPSPPLPRDPSWIFGCWPPCRPFHAYAPKPKFVFLRHVPVPYALFWLTKRIPSNPVHSTPPFPTVPGWTFRRWPPPCQIDLDRVTAILFFELYSCVRAPSFYSRNLQPRPSPTHPIFSQRFRTDVRALAADFAVVQRSRFLSLRTFAHLNPPLPRVSGSTSARWTPPHQIHPAKAEIIFQDHCPP
ncbi:hypothetical protein DFH08DRAFT_1086951 [Mycena albidolilacea]|uniref:Uncharacterized protein n=1 Tax=Mycena albidolilacea TaxID=1033008 RepID=A0AAD7EF14_9AGAR|nr:hypothetical protein DFH08DRAFT_1086951 [Mycena albidolilacea]